MNLYHEKYTSREALAIKLQTFRLFAIAFEWALWVSFLTREREFMTFIMPVVLGCIDGIVDMI